MDTDEKRAFRRRVRLWYAVAAILFALAMLVFILGIMAASGQVAGVGGVLLASSFVTAMATGIYHYVNIC